MNCPKCKDGTIDVVTHLVECIRRYDKQFMIPTIVEKYEEKTLWVRCCKCGFKLFGNVATKAFGILNKDSMFDDVVTDDDLSIHLKWIYGRKRNRETAIIRCALRNGWKPSLKVLWNMRCDAVSENIGFEFAELSEKQFRYNSERITCLVNDWFMLLDSTAELFLDEKGLLE